MKFSYEWLTSLFPIRESPQELAELLTMRAFEVDTIEKAGDDWALDVKIPANRISDAAGHEGLVREIAAIKNIKIKNAAPSAVKKQTRKSKYISVKIQKSELCPRYTAAILEIPHIGPSPQWIRNRLETCGIRPINAVVDVTNYILLETGQPLHAFDFEKIKGGEITIRESVKTGEKLTTLDGTAHTLPEGVIVIQDGEKLVDLAGIMGGENSAISSSTKKVLLQAAVFNPEKIYATGRVLRFSSQAAKIYSAGIDPNQTIRALESAIAFLAKNADAKEISLIDIYPKKIFPRKILFRPSYADSLIGAAPGKSYYQKAFRARGWNITAKKQDLVVEVPTYRQDLSAEEDLIEEMAREKGYENIFPVFSEAKIAPAERNEEFFWETRVRTHCAGAGFCESMLYEFTSSKELDNFFVDRENAVEIENPLNPETRYLTPRILTKFVVSAAENMRREKNIKIFGIGKSFLTFPDVHQASLPGISEQKNIIMVLSQKGASDEEVFYQVKGGVDQLIESMGISDHWYNDAIESDAREKELRMFHPYRVAEIKIGEARMGIVGEIHPEVLKNIKARERIVAAEINFDALWKLAREESEYRAPSKFPAIIRDIALLVPDETRTTEILNVVENSGGALLRNTDLFDYFRDEEMQRENRKSLAFHLVFQSDERTLIESEVDAIMREITQALKEKEWVVR